MDPEVDDALQELSTNLVDSDYSKHIKTNESMKPAHIANLTCSDDEEEEANGGQIFPIWLAR